MAPALLLSALAVLPAPVPRAPEEGLALVAAKALTCADGEPVVEDAVVLVREGRIERVGLRGGLAIPHHVVQATLAIQATAFGVPTFIDHGEMDAFLGTDGIEAAGIAAILGPRSVSWQSKGRGIDHDGRMLGLAAEYQRRGLSRIGFNTDSPVIPAETLQLQAGMAVRYGLDDSELAAVRGLTIVPAETAGIEGRVGSLEPGKDAGVLVLTGHPADPCTSIERVYAEGRLDDAAEERLW